MNNKIPKAKRTLRAAGVWIITMLSLVPIAFAQVESTGLFGSAGVTFLTAGVFILIIFFIGDQLFRQMRGKK